jgi:NADPH2:quinone reductase
MKALVLEKCHSQFVLKNLEKPVVEQGQVLVKIKASGVNPLDLKIKSNQAAHAQIKLPAILGVDLAGVIEAIGNGVTGFKLGDEVYGMTGGVAGIQGSLAEYAAVDADLLALKPKNLTAKEAAALPLIFITAWKGLVDGANVQAGQTVLIHGGAGGVGHIAIQIAKAKGAYVFSTIKPEKSKLIESYGATPIDYTQFSVEEYVSEYTNGEGFDIVLDTVGGSVLDASFKAVKRHSGHVVSVLGWGIHNLAPLSFREATYSGVFTLYPLISGKDRIHHSEILNEATQLIENGKLRPLIDPQHYTFDTIIDAYQAIEQRSANGKVVISIDTH